VQHGQLAKPLIPLVSQWNFYTHKNNCYFIFAIKIGDSVLLCSLTQCIFLQGNTMTNKNIGTFIKFGAMAAALAYSAAASATVELGSQYQISSAATQVSGNEYTFTYDVKNISQGVGGRTGFDGFTILIPNSAVIVGSTTPAPYVGAPGYWSQGASPTLDLRGDGSQNITAPSGYKTYTWWGQYTESVYQVGSTASFSITLGNVSVGSNLVGASTYFGYAVPTGQAYASNEYGNYTTFTTHAASAMAMTAVPEPATYAMLMAGLGMIGFATRRRKAAGAKTSL
jgi:hypothetical protein